MGNKLENLKKALKFLPNVKRISHIYESEPLGPKNQPYFLNCVAEIDTKLSPRDLLRMLKSIEKIMGRKEKKRWGPRIIDLDILFYGDLIIKEKDLIIPHPGISERKFFVYPLCDLIPDFIHPELKIKIYDLKRRLDASGFECKRYARPCLLV